MKIELIDAEQMAEILKINVQTLKKMAREEKIPYLRVGGSLRFNPEKVIKYFERIPRNED